ncbi:MAG TPA: hypothetical protein VF943_02710 [Burkholderiales bacterium]
MRPFSDVRNPLFDLHKALIDAERRAYELKRGRVADGAFLNALVEDPALAWLKPLTALIASIDGLAQDETFQRRYAELLQRSPDAVVAHGRVVQAQRR